mmetsp:Transcript_11486/g.16992  ORF Transcript_11486/g.16992 Transcript_11486/m.16992 type:complete len:565 (+) Transcript_11486:510-2204(+)
MQVNTYTDDMQNEPSVAALSNGGFVITWTSFGEDGGELGVSAQLFFANGTKVGNEFRVNTQTVGSQSKPSVSALENEEFIIVWEDANRNGVIGQRFLNNGTTLGGEIQLYTFIPGNKGNPSVTKRSNGGFVAVWESSSQDTSGVGVIGQCFTSNGQKIYDEFQANTFIVGLQNNPSITTLTNGYFVVTWLSLNQDGDSFGVYGQVINPNCAKVGPEFLVNDVTLGNQVEASIASFNNNSFIVTFSSSDGEQKGVFGRLFSLNTSCIVFVPPNATDDTFFLFESTSTVTGNVLENDTHSQNYDFKVVTVNDQPLSSSIEGPYSTLTMHEDGNFIFRLKTDKNHIKQLNTGRNLTITYLYKVKDEFNETAMASLIFVILGENNPPLLFAASSVFSVYEDDISYIQLYASDVDDTNLLLEFYDKSSQRLTPEIGFTLLNPTKRLQINGSRTKKAYYDIRAKLSDPHGATSTFNFRIHLLKKFSLNVENDTTNLFDFNNLQFNSKENEITLTLKMDPLLNKFRLPKDSLKVSYENGVLEVSGSSNDVNAYLKLVQFSNGLSFKISLFD